MLLVGSQNLLVGSGFDVYEIRDLMDSMEDRQSGHFRKSRKTLPGIRKINAIGMSDIGK
jgi:hypothetical protein